MNGESIAELEKKTGLIKRRESSFLNKLEFNAELFEAYCSLARAYYNEQETLNSYYAIREARQEFSHLEERMRYETDQQDYIPENKRIPKTKFFDYYHLLKSTAESIGMRLESLFLLPRKKKRRKELVKVS